MGAYDFEQIITGATLQGAYDAAYEAACADARAKYGDGYPYSGTIATTSGVLLFGEPLRTEEKARRRAQELLRQSLTDEDPLIEKWGPAGALPIHPVDGRSAWLAFGWAAC